MLEPQKKMSKFTGADKKVKVDCEWAAWANGLKEA